MLDFSIPQPTAPFVDPKTGHISTPWYLFLNSLSQTISPSGVVPVVDGGTGLTSGTSGGILGFTAATTLASSVLLTSNAIILGGGAGATPSPLASLGTATTVLHGNAGGPPTFGAVNLSTDASGTLLAGQFPALTGDITTTAGSLATTLKNTGTAGTYTKTTFDAQGRETSGTSAILASADFANQGTTTTVLHGNASGNPSFGAVVLTTDVSGTLPTGSGGTGVTGSSLGGANGVVLGDSGTFTPLIVGTTSAGTATQSIQQGNYSREGNRIIYNFTVVWSATTGTGNLAVNGLPFTSNSGSNTGSPLVIYMSDNIALATSFFGLVQPNVSQVLIEQYLAGTGATAVPIQASGTMLGAGTYLV